jgi:hypothetical protein
MLNYRREERERKGISEDKEKYGDSKLSLEMKKDDDEAIQQYVADDPTMALPASATDFLPEITGVDPFDAFPIKIEPYMLELLLCCAYFLLYLFPWLLHFG